MTLLADIVDANGNVKLSKITYAKMSDTSWLLHNKWTRSDFGVERVKLTSCQESRHIRLITLSVVVGKY